MDSRLDRLLILLDTGSSESIRMAAAKQLGEVQKVQPNDLGYLLKRIKEYSSKSVWETRVAAGHATRFVIEQIEPWPASSPNNEPITADQAESKTACRLEIADKLLQENINIQQIIDSFDLEKIMSLCPKLLSLKTTDDEDPTTSSLAGSNSPLRGSRTARGDRRRKLSTKRSVFMKNDKDQLMRQRKLINKELGIMDGLNLGVKSTDIVSNDDLQLDYDSGGDSLAMSSTKATCDTSLTNNTSPNSPVQVSHYQIAMHLLIGAGFMLEDGSETKDIPQKSSSEHQSSNTSNLASSAGTWPLLNIASQYSLDLFNPSWEIRHGAAIALREIVKKLGMCAGKRSDLGNLSNSILNQLWLTDMALKCISVLALDKFGDFLFDQVVAPVRENAAQLLGCCVAYMSEIYATSILQILKKMLNHSNWETRHGGILGLKYSMNVIDSSFSKRILHDSFDDVFKCLADSVDDVSGEAAAALVSVKDLMIDTIPDKTPELIKFLWDHLANLDELTSSTSNIVLLLSSLITSSSSQLEPSELEKSIPRLWSLLGHSSTSVRISVLRALKTLLSAKQTPCSLWLSEDLETTLLRLIMQRSILENVEEVREYIEDVWRILIRTNENPSSKFNLLKCTSKYLNHWLCLVMQPTNMPIDRGSEMWLNLAPDGSKSTSRPNEEVYIGSCTFNAESIDLQKIQVTKCRLFGSKLLGALYATLIADLDESNPESQHTKETLKYLSDMFIHYIKTKSAHQRIISGWTLESWANVELCLLNNDREKMKTILPKDLVTTLELAIQETTTCYDELATTFTRLQQETREFVAHLKTAHIPPPNIPLDKKSIYNIAQIQFLCDLNIENELIKVASKRTSSTTKNDPTHNVKESKDYKFLSSKRNELTKTMQQSNSSHKSLSTSVLAALASAIIAWQLLPTKHLRTITNSILDSIELEVETILQDKSIDYMLLLFDILCDNYEENNDLIDDILQKLVNVLSNDHLSTTMADYNRDDISKESAALQQNNDNNNLQAKGTNCDTYRIVLLDNLQRMAELSRNMSRRQSSIGEVTSLKRSHSLASNIELDHQQQVDVIQSQEELNNSRRRNAIDETKLRGASVTLSRLAEHFGDNLPAKLPILWRNITQDIKLLVIQSKSGSLEEVTLIKNMRILKVMGESLSESLRKHLLDLFPHLIDLLTTPNPLIRHYSAECIGVISKLMFSQALDLIINNIVPMLEDSSNVLARCGAVEAIAMIIEHLQLELVPKVDLFVVHILRRMSDQNDQVRLLATHCFGKLLILMPLKLNKQEAVNKPKTTPETLQQRDTEANFIEQLLNPKKLDHFELPMKIEADLRTYQQEGLNWLAFLNRFNLHGILCDEMGLGKTLMTICMVVSNFVLSTRKTSTTTSTVNGNTLPTSHDRCLPSLIVCPATLVEHWLYELHKFLPAELREQLNPMSYGGTNQEKMIIRSQMFSRSNQGESANENSSSDLKAEVKKVAPAINLIVASYDNVRNNVDFFKEVNWSYCVLDEGHIIKNGKTKLSRAVRLLTAKHRLILSGTPIQNNVTELWSLFDFLMPGFLGSDRQFNSKYTKPILQSREPKCSVRELEAGALAMESLHRQVLPFILRRTKEHVLSDLPPKIIQDYYCELSPLQHKLYEDFTRSRLCNDVTKRSIQELEESDDKGSLDTPDSAKNQAKSKGHVFQALQYLRNVCNHPKLVLTPKHSQFAEIKQHLENQRSSLDDLEHSSKLKALRQLLLDCGIGIQTATGDEQTAQQQKQDLELNSVVKQHRVLVFCQLRSMLDIIENDLLLKYFPGTTYLKLNGSVPSHLRHSIVSRFNNDPSIDILLLTTQIGGLGLNLTGADTVIFVEHDWNPTKDLQAMDRAHRIGQKKVVNVYRLITKGTLEEKIMGLQKFKTMVSNTVINQDNSQSAAGGCSMSVFDLFEDALDNNRAIAGGGKQRAQPPVRGATGKSSFVELLPELWNQQQYETEYDLSNFISSLKS